MTAPALIVMGASAGALETLTLILSPLSQKFPIPIAIVVHLPPDKKSILVDVLQSKCSIRIREAEDKDNLEGGYVYIAPPDYHLLIENDLRISLSSEEPVLYSRPSINVLFESAADACGENLLGIILTGANNDGAAGLQAIIGQGGTGLVQAPQSAYASAMPEAALALSSEALPMTLEEISDYVMQAGTAYHES